MGFVEFCVDVRIEYRNVAVKNDALNEEIVVDNAQGLRIASCMEEVGLWNNGLGKPTGELYLSKCQVLKKTRSTIREQWQDRHG